MKPEALNVRQYLVAAGLVVSGALAVLQINDSPYLPGAHSDSVEYMEAGRSLALGNGLTVPTASWSSPDSVAPLSHFPPGPSLAIAVVMRTTGVRPDIAALWLMALSAGLSLGLSFLIVASVSGWVAALVTALLVGVMSPFPLAHTSVWSEPLYLPLLLLTLVLMVLWPRRPLAAGCAAALSVLVRYLGVATVAAVGMWAFFRTRSIKQALLGVAPGSLVFLTWSVMASARGGAVRTPGEYGVALTSTLSQLPDMIRFWLAPNLPVLVAMVLLVGVVTAHVMERKSYSIPLAMLLVSHLAVVFFARLFVDQRIPFDSRILLPVLVLAMLPVASWVKRWKRVGLVVAFAWIAFVAWEDVRGIRSLQERGQYYSSVEWIASELVTWIDNESHGIRLYSNEPGLLFYQSQRHARWLPLETHDLDEFVAVWRQRPGAIVLVAPMRQDELPPQFYLENLPLQVALESDNALVLVPLEEAGDLSSPF